MQGEKRTMEDLNNHLTSSLERIRSLQADNKRLEFKIWDYLKKKGSWIRDWGHYFKTI